MSSLIKSVYVALILGALSACGSVAVEGQRRGAVPKSIDSLGIYFQVNSFTEGDYTTLAMANWKTNTLFPIMIQRLPVIFKANGLKLPGTLSTTGIKNDLLPSQLDCCEYVLRLRPESYSTGGKQRGQFKVAADIYSKNSGVVWSGAMAVNDAFGSDGLMGVMADKLLAELLTRLNDDGIISVAKVTVPDPALAPLPALAAFDAVPGLDEAGKQAYRNFVQSKLPRAFAISLHGGWSSASGRDKADPALPDDPSERALANCKRNSGEPCKLYAVDRAVLWKGF